MAYIMGLGEKPKGECYYHPTSETEGWLMAQYYDGTKVKLIQFKKPLSSPVAGSTVKRIEKLEDDVQSLKNYTEAMFSGLCGCQYAPIGFSPYSAYQTTVAHPSMSTNAPFVITNCEHYLNKRGW